jgi:hypothetical protein
LLDNIILDGSSEGNIMFFQMFLGQLDSSVLHESTAKVVIYAWVKFNYAVTSKVRKFPPRA